MSQELHYTSVPRGLKPGTRGFCTVAVTPQMPGPLVERLESLSGYQPVYPPHDPAASRNPVVFSHVRFALAGRPVSILSRVGPAGLDYTGRANKYAHHVVLDATERPEGGPAWLLGQPGFMQSAWDGEPRSLADGRPVPRGDGPAGMAAAWAALTGDAGWAGVLAESFLAGAGRTAFLVFRPGIDLLPLFAEAIALLPPPRRWDVEFSTYLAQAPRGMTYNWRGVLEGSIEAANARRLPNSLIIDLCGAPARAQGGPLVHSARTGERPDFAPAAFSVSPPLLSAHRPGPELNQPEGDDHRPAAIPLPAPTGAYELIPELARHEVRAPLLVLPAGLPRHVPSKRRTWIAACIAAACLISLAVLFLVLRIEVQDLMGSKGSTRQLIAEQRKQIEQDHPAEAPKLPAPPATAQEPKEPDAEKPKPAPRAVEKKDKNGAPGSSPPNPDTPPSKGRAAPKKVLEPSGPALTQASFFPLPDLVVSVLTKTPDTIDLNTDIADIKLLQDDKMLTYNFIRGPAEGRLSVYPKSEKGEPADLKTVREIARFKILDQTIRFEWVGHPGKEDQIHLQDSVLVVSPKTGSPAQDRYYILRKQPRDLKGGICLKTDSERMNPLNKKPSVYRINWDNGEFKNSRGRLSIHKCWQENRGQDQPVVTDKGTWTIGDGLCEIKFHETDHPAEDQDQNPSKVRGTRRKTVKTRELQAILQYGDPVRVGKAIENIKKSISKKKPSKPKLKDSSRKANTPLEEDEKIRQTDAEIAGLEAELAQLQSIDNLYKSSLNIVIYYTVSDRVFQIAGP